MRIIKTSALRAFWEIYPDAEASLRNWIAHTKAAEWDNCVRLRQTFPDADQVRVGSGRLVVVFNIARNRYRLIAAVHYNTGMVYTLRVLRHKDYDHETWKRQL